MANFVYKGLTKNPENGNTLARILPNIQRLGQVKDTIFGTNVSNEMLYQMLQNSRFTVLQFLLFLIIEGKLTGGVRD